MGVSSRHNVISLDTSVCNLANDIGVGKSDYKPVFGCIIFVLGLNNKAFSSVVIGLSLPTPAELDLIPAEVRLVFKVQEEGKKIEIRNFLGEKFVRKVNMREGVTVSSSTKQKDELVVEGNDIEQVSLSAALIQQSTTVK